MFAPCIVALEGNAETRYRLALTLEFHPAEDFAADIAALLEGERRHFQRFLPLGDAVGEAEVRIQEIAAGLEDSGDLGQEAWEIRVAVRGLDIDDGIERSLGKWQLLRVSADESQPRLDMARIAEFHPFRVEIEAGILRRALGAGQVGCAAAVAAAHLEDVLSLEIHLHAHVVIELDARAVRLVRRLQRHGHRGLRLIGIVQENYLLPAQPAGQERIPHPPDRFPQRADGKQVID